jgi:hypothetical protein
MAYKKFLQGVVSICAFVLVLIIGMECDRRADKSLRLKKVSVQGICTEVSPAGGSYVTIRYYFVTKKSRHHRDRFAMLKKTASRRELEKLLVGKKFPVIYDSTWFRNSQMLIFKEDFLRFEYAIPDSLVSLVNHIDSIMHRQPASL